MLNTKHCYLKQLIYCYNNTNFIIVFLSEKDHFLRCKVHYVSQAYLFSFYLCKIICKRPEVNGEPTYHFLIFKNYGKTFSSLYGMACSYQCSDQFQLLPGHWQSKRYRISWDLEKLNLLEKNPNNTRNNMSQIQNKKYGGNISLWNL